MMFERGSCFKLSDGNLLFIHVLMLLFAVERRVLVTPLLFEYIFSGYVSLLLQSTDFHLLDPETCARNHTRISDFKEHDSD